MESYKRQKIIKIVREIGYSGNKYQINGIVLTKAIFFIKKGKELFKLIANGDYTITTEGTNTFIVINNAILDGVLSLQIGYELNTLSGKYEVHSDPDINILKDKYNTLVDDFKNLWDYVQKQTLVSDTLSMELILPKLENGETWVYKDNEMKATFLYDAIEELKKSVEDIKTDFMNQLNTLINNFNTNINSLITNFRIEIENKISTGKAEINTLVNNSKTDINTLVTNQKTSITELTNNSKVDINTTANNQKTSITTLVDNSKIQIANLSITEKASITNHSTTEKTEITDLTEVKKDEIRDFASTILGFEPINYLQIGTSKYTTAKQIEDDIKNIKVTPTMSTLFEGSRSIMDRNSVSVNATFSNILLGVTYGTLIIRFDSKHVFEMKVELLNDGIEFYIPSERVDNPFWVFFTVTKVGNDLKISSPSFTGIVSANINKIVLIK